MTVRIMHAADLHLGRTFPELGDASSARGSDLFDTFEHICDQALNHEVAALLLAGDLFDTFAPPAEMVARVGAQFERLTHVGVQVLVVPGDADSVTYERSIWRREAFADVHVFLAPTFETQSFEVGDTTVHVHGVAFDKSTDPDPVRSLQTGTPGIHIGMLHGTVDGSGGSAGADAYFPVDSVALFTGGISYAALGHQHSRRQLFNPDCASACYPGSPEGLGTGEEGARYVALVEFDDGPPEVSFLEVNRRQVISATVDTTDRGTNDVVEKLLELAGDDVLMTVRLAGTPHEVLDAVALSRTVADRFFWIELRDETTLSASPFVDVIAAENTIRGHFVGTLQRRIRGTQDTEELAALERALKLGLRSLQRSDAA